MKGQNVRPLTPKEASNLQVVAASVRDYALLFITGTGLDKSILDSTLPMRTLFSESGFHNYASQGLGRKEYGIDKRAIFLTDSDQQSTSLSLYRPMTKKGDPRMWPSRLKDFCEPGDALAVFIHEDTACFVNLAKSKVALENNNGTRNLIALFLKAVEQNTFSIAEELLAR